MISREQSTALKRDRKVLLDRIDHRVGLRHLACPVYALFMACLCPIYDDDDDDDDDNKPVWPT
jgi:hypothetical protein